MSYQVPSLILAIYKLCAPPGGLPQASQTLTIFKSHAIAQCGRLFCFILTSIFLFL